MSQFRLSRRAVLKGAGTIAIALPWLEIMEPPRRARAAPAPTTAKRFIAVYQPGGTVRGRSNNGVDRWVPTDVTSETSFKLSPILAPLEDVKQHVLIADGFNMDSAVGEQHQGGIIAFLTGSTQANGGSGYSTGPSLDQVLSKTLSLDKKQPSLQMAVRWATGKSHGNLSPINCLNFEKDNPFSPVPPSLDPQKIFSELFGSLTSGQTTSAAEIEAKRQKSILDFLDRRYAGLTQKLGAADRAKMDEHLTKIRELEKSLAVNVPMSAVCKVPTKVGTSGYDPRSGLNSADDGAIKDESTDEAIPVVGKFMMDMLVMALACDITGVGTLQWTDTEAKHTFPWLGLSEHHHFYEHDGGFRPAECEKIARWYSSQHAYLLAEMAKVDMGGHTLLDESVLFFGSELSDPPTHSKSQMPFLLAGGGGGLRGGRYVKYDSQSHNNLLVSILNLFGDDRDSFGTPEHCTGPAGKLT